MFCKKENIINVFGVLVSSNWPFTTAAESEADQPTPSQGWISNVYILQVRSQIPGAPMMGGSNLHVSQFPNAPCTLPYDFSTCSVTIASNLQIVFFTASFHSHLLIFFTIPSKYFKSDLMLESHFGDWGGHRGNKHPEHYTVRQKTHHPLQKKYQKHRRQWILERCIRTKKNHGERTEWNRYEIGRRKVTLTRLCKPVTRGMKGGILTPSNWKPAGDFLFKQITPCRYCSVYHKTHFSCIVYMCYFVLSISRFPTLVIREKKVWQPRQFSAIFQSFLYMTSVFYNHFSRTIIRFCRISEGILCGLFLIGACLSCQPKIIACYHDLYML